MAEQAAPANHTRVEPPGPDSNCDENQGAVSRLMSQEGVFQLTCDLRKFSETLTSLKAVFCEEKVLLDQSLRVAAHERLGELLKVLKEIVNKYVELNSTGILNAAESLINHIKNFNYESVEETVPPEIFTAINNLALAFSSSVSECLIGDINISPRQSMASTQSYENINPGHQLLYHRQSTVDGLSEAAPTSVVTTDGAGPLASSETVADVLEKTTENLEVCFERAKTWSKYANDLLTYVKKKAHIELEYAKQLTKLSQATRSTLSEESYLPFRSLYCTAVDHDKEYASRITTTYQSQILANKFIELLHAQRLEHDKQHKNVWDVWRKYKRRLEEAEANLKKAKQQYYTRIQEYRKAKEAATRADMQQYAAGLGDGTHSRQGSGSSTSQLAHNVATGQLGIIPTAKAEKKKKQENDSYLKAMQAEQYYRACVNEANSRRRELGKKEEEFLKTLTELMTQCDQTTKSVTHNFFWLKCELVSPLRIQYEALLEDLKNYEPGHKYAEYLKHVTPRNVETRQDYQFESYPTTEGAAYLEQSIAPTRDTLHEESSPVAGRPDYAARSSAARRTSHRGFSDTESSSSRSLDDISPSESPGDPGNRKDMQKRRPSTEGSLSSEEILDEPKDNIDPTRLSAPHTFKDFASYSPDSSPAPLRSQIQMPKMMKMVANVKEALKGMKRNQKMTVFGVDFAVAVQDMRDGIPILVKKCIAEIDNRALTVKGIYRVNGVKNRVEKLCSLLDSPHCARADLSEQLPHDVSGVLKFFLRQLPEPLLLHRLYDEFLEVAKEYNEIMKERQPPSDSVAPSGDGNEAEEVAFQMLPDPQEQEAKLLLVTNKMRAVIDKLPTANRNTLQYIIAHLSRVADHHTSNKMTASNLAIIFGPTLLRPLPSIESGKELQSLLDLPSQSHTIEMLITHRDKIFDTYSQKAQNEEVQEQIKAQNSIDVDEAPPDPNHEMGAVGSQVPKLVPLHTEPSTDLPNEDQTNVDQILITVDNQSTSGTSSSGETFTSEETTRLGQKDSSSGYSTLTSQSNGGMNAIDDRRTILPNSTGLTKSSSTRDLQGGFLSAFFGERNIIRDDISIGSGSAPTGLAPRGDGRAVRPTSLTPGQQRRIGTGSPSPHEGHSPTKGRAFQSAPQATERQQGDRSLARDAGLGSARPDAPIAPIRIKSKRRSSDKGKAFDLTQTRDPSAQKPASPHRPRSQRIDGNFSRPSQDLIDIGDFSMDTTDPRRASVAGPLRTINDPNISQTKRHSTAGPLIHPTTHKPSDPKTRGNPSFPPGRKLPQVPASKQSNAGSPTRPKPVSMPGRTPPFNKTQVWSFAKGDIVDIDNQARDEKGSGIQRKILMESEEEEVSFC